jgi:hypothetical protein
MGIVTWASLKCELLPTVRKSYLVPAKKSTDLEDFVYKTIWGRVGDRLFVMNKAYLAYLMGDTVEQIAELKTILPNWVAPVSLSGDILLPELKVESQEYGLKEYAKQTGVHLLPEVPGVTADEVIEKASTPSGENYWKLTYKGGCQDIFFVTTLDKTPKFIEAMYELAIEVGYPTEDIGIYIQPQHMGTSVHLEFSLPYNPDNAREAKLVKELYTAASMRMSKLGAFFSRPYDIWSTIQLNKDAQYYMLLRKVKEIFDPDNIMNPGKLTIK